MLRDRDRALSALLALDPGMSRETWVRVGMAAKAAGLTLEDFTEWSRRASNFGSDRDCASVWRSFDDGPVKAGTLYSMAFSAEWEDPARTRHNGRASRLPNAIRHRTGIATDCPQRPGIGPEGAILNLWNRCEPATAAHPYIIAKRGRPDGLHVVPAGDSLTIGGQSVAGWLVVPVHSLDGDLKTLQLIPPPGTGKKLNMPGASFGDGLFVVGDLTQSARVFIVEGIGQAWACWSATGCAAVVSFGAGRMATVSQAVRHRHPDSPMVLVPDRGKEAQAESIARAVRGEWVELPHDKPPNYDVSDYADEHGAHEMASLLERTQKPPMRYRLLEVRDLLSSPRLHWLVRGVVPAQGLACMYGASGSGKSFLALDMCAAVADGAEWFDCRVTVAPVVYVALEGEHGFRQRVNAWQIHRGHDLPARLRFVMQPFDLRNADDLTELAAAVKACGGAGGLLVIDTLSRAASGADENSSTDMGEIIDAAKVLQSRLGGTVLLIHHSGKDQTKGLRGHSSLHAALDAAIEVTRSEDRREWRVAKSKDDSDSTAYPFRLKVIEIGTDEHGDRVTSCAVVPDDRTDDFRRLLPPKSGNQRIAWDTLGEMLKRTAIVRPDDAPESLPVGRPVVTLERATEAIRERLACEPKRKTERALQALTGLHSKGLICVDRGFVWVT